MGRTLATLWHRAGVFAIQDVLSRTPDSGRTAVAFIGAGTSVAAVADMHPAEVWLVATPDDRIAASAAALAERGGLRAGDIVFHCSGALCSAELHPASGCGAHLASVHPVKSFADPAAAVESFAGTWCAAEGDALALAALEPAFARIGARVRRIEPGSKLLYHAGNVFASNYLVALMEAALRCYALAGISAEDARAMVEPLARETIGNISGLGTTTALTGPIARGDSTLVARQLAALEKTDARMAAVYRQLAAIAVELAREKGEAGASALEAIQGLLASASPAPRGGSGV